MYRERALLKFKRYYLHGIRNGHDSEKSATEAMWKTRNELLEELKEDPEFQNDHAKEELWADALIQIMLLRMMLANIPIDRAELLRRKEAQLLDGDSTTPAPPKSPSSVVADSFIKGLEAKDAEHDGPSTNHP